MGRLSRLSIYGVQNAILGFFGLVVSLNFAYAGCPAALTRINGIHDGAINDLVVIGDYAYIVGEGFSIIDVADSNNWFKVGSYPVDGEDIAVDGLVAYVAGSAGLVILDVSDPENPRALASLPFSPNGLRRITVLDHYVIVSEESEGLHVIDVANPLSPTVVGEYSYFLDSSHDGLSVYGPYILFASENDFHVISLEDPTAPLLIGSYHGSFWRLADITSSGRFVFVADSSGSSDQDAGGIQVFDLSDPLTPQLVGHYKGDHFSYAYSVSVSGRLALLVGSSGFGGISGVHIVDMSNPVDPAFISTFGESSWGGGQIVGRKGFLWNSGDIIEILDISDCYFLTIFVDGFESGDTTLWSAISP